METTKRFLMNREGIGFFKAIMESYEDIAVFSVIDGGKGLIELIYPSNFSEEVRLIMEDMRHYGIVFREAADD